MTPLDAHCSHQLPGPIPSNLSCRGADYLHWHMCYSLRNSLDSDHYQITTSCWARPSRHIPHKTRYRYHRSRKNPIACMGYTANHTT